MHLPLYLYVYEVHKFVQHVFCVCVCNGCVAVRDEAMLLNLCLFEIQSMLLTSTFTCSDDYNAITKNIALNYYPKVIVYLEQHSLEK